MKDEMGTNKSHMSWILTGTWSTEIQTGTYDPTPPPPTSPLSERAIVHTTQDQASWRRLTVDCSSVNWWWLAQSSLQLTNRLQAKSVLILFPFHNNVLFYRYLKWRSGSKDLRLYQGIECGTSPVILLQMVMVCPGTHLVKSLESQLKKKVWNWKCCGFYVIIQLIRRQTPKLCITVYWN